MNKTFDVVQAMSGQKNVVVIPRPYLQMFKGDQQAHALGAVLSNLVFWSAHGDSDGWFYKSHAELGEEAGELSEDQTERLVKKIISKYLPGVFETCSRKVNGTPTKHYRIDGDRLIAAIFPDNSDSAKVRNGNRKATESKPQHHGKETANERNPGNREVTESYLYTDCNTDCNLQTNTDGRQAAPAQQQLDYQSVLDVYHQAIPEMPRVADFTDSRRDKLRTFWRKFDFTQERWEAYLRYIAKNCRWMCENRPDSASGRTWRKKNFDYLITERCYLSVKEERANDLPKPTETGKQRDITVIPSTDYEIPHGFRGE